MSSSLGDIAIALQEESDPSSSDEEESSPQVYNYSSSPSQHRNPSSRISLSSSGENGTSSTSSTAGISGPSIRSLGTNLFGSSPSMITPVAGGVISNDSPDTRHANGQQQPHSRRSSMPVMMKDEYANSPLTSGSYAASSSSHHSHSQSTHSRALSSGGILRRSAASNAGAGGDEGMSAQYNLEIAVGTINELQNQLVHSNRTIEQLAAENVALTRDLKKAKKMMGRMQAKVLKANQVQADITPGARKILQETIEENSRMLGDFMEMVNRGGMPFSARSRGSSASNGQHDQQQQQYHHHDEQYGQMRTLIDQLTHLKQEYESLLTETIPVGGGSYAKTMGGGNNSNGLASARIRELEMALNESQRRLEEARSSRKKENELEKEVESLKRQVKFLQKSGPEITQLLQEEITRLRTEYSSLQKHALVVSMQNDSLREELDRAKERNRLLKTNVDEARELYRSSGGQQAKAFQGTIMKQVDEIDALRQKVKDRESMLRTQLELKSAYEKELRAKRKEVLELKKLMTLPKADPNKTVRYVNRQKAVNLRNQHTTKKASIQELESNNNNNANNSFGETVDRRQENAAVHQLSDDGGGGRRRENAAVHQFSDDEGDEEELATTSFLSTNELPPASRVVAFD